MKVNRATGAKMEAIIKQVDGLSLIGKAGSNHWIAMDAAEDVGGSNAGSRPLELLLLGLGGCTAMDVISILKKKRSPVKNITIALKADRAEEFPKIFTEIKLKFFVYGDKENIKPRDIERAIELSSTQYCSASNMLKKSANIEYEYEIVDD